MSGRAQMLIFCQICIIYELWDLLFRIISLNMPPKKKNEVKAAKAAKADTAKAAQVDRSASKSKSVDKTKTAVVAKSKPQPKKPQPKKPEPKVAKSKAKSPEPVAVTPEPKGRRGAKTASPAPADPPAKKVKGQQPTKTQSKDKPVAASDPSPAKDAAQTSKVKAKQTAAVDKDEQQIVKVVTKGGAAVDQIVPGKQNYRVYQDGGKTYAATLNQANLDHNNNKFYIVQILLNQKTGALHVWNRWGRVGTPGQHCLKGPSPKDSAIRDYNGKIHDKTVKGDYKQIQIKYDDQQEKKPQKKPKKANNVASKMDAGLQKLIGLIFDTNIMDNTMKQIGYDAKKMPLGRLGDNTIKQAYNILNQLTEAIRNNQTSQYSKLSSEFYTLIPHNIGFDKMSNYILNNDEKVKQKIRMLEAISDMKITTKLLDQDGDDDTAVHDQNYKKLGCSIKTLEKNGKDYSLLKQYFDNTKGMFNKVDIGEIYEVVRPTEHSTYNSKIGNNMLLWHGSRITNFVGILSQGLRIAPPEAPVSGYLFGKGIYLADLAEKSIHYCRSAGSAKALILLIEGAIGNPNILLTSSYQAKQLMQKNGKHSTKCHGAKAPPESSYVTFNNMTVPKGKPAPTGSGSYMGHNEYIVYNMNQARIRYILQMNMGNS